MTGQNGVEFVKNNFSKYETIMKDNLTLKRYEGTMNTNGDDIKLKFQLRSPMVVVIAIK
jgi:hypothetical protein